MGRMFQGVLYRYWMELHMCLKTPWKRQFLAGVEHTSTSAQAPSVDSEPAETRLPGTSMSDTQVIHLRVGLDQPVPLRCGTCTTPAATSMDALELCISGRYSLPGIWDAWGGLCICLHFISCLIPHFLWEV